MADTPFHIQWDDLQDIILILTLKALQNTIKKFTRLKLWGAVATFSITLLTFVAAAIIDLQWIKMNRSRWQMTKIDIFVIIKTIL